MQLKEKSLYFNNLEDILGKMQNLSVGTLVLVLWKGFLRTKKVRLKKISRSSETKLQTMAARRHVLALLVASKWWACTNAACLQSNCVGWRRFQLSCPFMVMYIGNAFPKTECGKRSGYSWGSNSMAAAVAYKIDGKAGRLIHLACLLKAACKEELSQRENFWEL